MVYFSKKAGVNFVILLIDKLIRGGVKLHCIVFPVKQRRLDDEKVQKAHSPSVGGCNDDAAARVGMTTNDPEAKALAETSFDCIKPADGNFYLNMEDENHNVLTNKWSKVDKAQGIMMYALPLPEDSNVDLMRGYHYKVREITSEMLRNMDISSVTSAYKSALKGFTDKGAEVTAIGVAAKTINGKTYVSLGVKMKISLSDSN